MGTLLDRFDEHDGPVRGVGFHYAQPLIVSGGDDYRIKVWDYKLRRCLFTLLGHLDYIRTVCFHGDYPWLVSASDDQTIRIWNWQSRSCVSVLTGHNHYVMCASFHPRDDLIVSASLDQTVRVWDITGLRKKTVRGAPSSGGGSAATALHDLGVPGSSGTSSVVSRVNADLFGGNDAVVKYVLEGHDRGVNWASFHPTLPLIISGADDRQVKLWRMNDTKAWEVDTMRGHTNNVSCVVFHPKHELIISNSEDRSIRVWDISKRLGVQTFRRENDRFWILAAHPQQNLLAAGHDSGMIVFKLERERPAYASHAGRMFYVKDRYLRTCEYSSGRDVPTLSLRRAGPSNSVGGNPRSLDVNTFNSSENNILMFFDSDGGTYELISFHLETSAAPTETTDTKRCQAVAAVFLARNRFAVLDKNRQIIVKDFMNEKRKSISPPNPSTDRMFFAGISGRLLLRSDDRITLFEPQSRRILAELQIPRVKYVLWNKDCTYVALISKHGITITSRDMEQLCSLTESVRVKSGTWDSNSRIFVYTTLNHIKYCLINGDTGIIRTLDVPVYITRVHNNQLFCLDRECKTRIISIDITEAKFKLALEDKNYPDVMHMIRNSRLCGKAIIGYLQDKGFPEVALHFVDDLKTRFKLALACGNIEIAMNTAYEMGDDASWHQLGIEALRQGNYQVVEMAYQRTKNFERLSFLYLLTGNTEKLRKMLKIAEMRQDLMARFHNSLFLGDALQRVKILEEAGQVSLAYLTSLTHGLVEEEQRLRAGLKSDQSIAVCADAQLMQPPTPILHADNWPLLSIPKRNLYEKEPPTYDTDANYEPMGKEWEEDLDLEEPGDVDEIVGSGWDDDLDLNDELSALDTNINTDLSQGSTPSHNKTTNYDGLVVPTLGMAVTQAWCNNSSHAADHIAAGSFDSAMQLLNRQIAAVHFPPMKSRFILILSSSLNSLPGLPLATRLHVPLCRSTTNEISVDSGALPDIAITMPHLIQSLKSAYKTFQKGEFSRVQCTFNFLLMSIPLVITETRTASHEVNELLEICREYTTAVRIKNTNVLSSGQRQMELSAYFTHCNLQPGHLALALNLAMSQSYKGGNFITAASFARRVLELPDMTGHQNDIRSKAQLVLKNSEQKARNEHTLNYDERNPFDIECNGLFPIYRGSPSILCPYCRSTHAPDMKGRVCATCNLAVVGVETLGLVSQSHTKR